MGLYKPIHGNPMHLHFAIPGFHAAVHQAALPRLHGRPVAVVADAGEDAPVLSVSPEAHRAGARPGQRSGQTRQSCPEVTFVTPEPVWYARTQQTVVSLAQEHAACVTGGSGQYTLAVAQDPDATIAIAQDLQQRLAAGLRLRLRCHLGLAARPEIAELAARAAVAGGTALQTIALGNDASFSDPLPLAWCPGLGRLASTRLAEHGLSTIGSARRLGGLALFDLLGSAATPLVNLLCGPADDVVPWLTDPTPAISATYRCSESGADAAGACRLAALLAREISHRLENRHLAGCRLTLAGRLTDGRHASAEHVADQQLHSAHDLTTIAQRLVTRLSRSTPWERLHLALTDLCAAELQQTWFAATPPVRAPNGGLRLVAA